MRFLNLIKYVNNWPSYVLHKFGISKKTDFRFQLRNNLIALVPVRLLPTFKEIFLADDYFRGFPKEQQALTNKAVVFDIGANVGYFSLFTFCRQVSAQVYAFEPMEVNYKLLRQQKEANDKLDFHIYNQAIAAEAGILELTYDASDSFTTSATILETQIGADVMKVECVSLLSVLDKEGLENIDFLKLDCEGAEYEIVYNISDELFQRIDRIAMETHRSDKPAYSLKTMAQFLSDKGFQVNTAGSMIWAYKD